MATLPAHRTAQRVLTENKWLRLATVALFYFTQGVPQGLFFVALPAWLAAEGASAADIATVVSITLLPASIKFLNGFLMDRYTYLPMGRRRAWIIAAQLGLVGSFLAGAILSPDSSDTMLLAGLGFVASLSYAFQDVGIDRLAIDIMPDEERAKAASLMFGSGILGISAMTWLGGVMLAQYGVGAAFAAAAVAPVAVAIFGIAVRERAGEKLLPWSEGNAHPRNLAIQIDAWLPLLKNAFKALLAPASLVFLLVLASRAIPQGVGDTLHPLLAARDAGWELTDYTNLLSLSQLTAGILALTVDGFVVDRLGVQKSLAIVAAVIAAYFTTMILLREHWGNDLALGTYLFCSDPIFMLLIVSIIPIAMRICSPAVAATQFAIYMAAGNVGRPIGAALLGWLGVDAAVPIFGIFAALFAGLCLLAIFFRFPVNNIDEPAGDLAPDPARP